MDFLYVLGRIKMRDNNFVTLFDDTKIICYNNCSCCGNLDFISKNLLLNKCWEPNISFLFNYLLKNKKDSIVFDVGCNIGYYSLISSKYCQKIYAFDANINNINMIIDSMQLNNITNIQTICCAVSDTTNKLFKTDRIHEHNIGSLKVVEVTNPNESNISSITLDSFIKNNNIQDIDILKIDIEGSEMSCLKGLEDTLQQDIIKNIIIEITPLWSVEEAKDILLYLQSKKYLLFDAGLNETGSYIEDEEIYNKIINNQIFDVELFLSKVKIQTNILAKKDI
jgi:FkbM family methyltransferase